MSTTVQVAVRLPRRRRRCTLAEPPTAPLGLRDTAGLFGNLGVSLLLPVAAAFVVLPGRPLLALTLTASSSAPSSARCCSA